MATNHSPRRDRRRSALAAALGFASALAAASCSSTRDEADSDEAPGIRVKSGDEFFGLDYTIDPETGMMKNERSREFPREEYYAGRDAVKTSEHLARQSSYQTSAYREGEAAYRTSEAATKPYRATASRYQGRANRSAGRRAREGESRSPYGSESYATSPYRRGAEMMETGAYREAADAQAQGSNPPPSEVRQQRAGDPGVAYREADGLTIDDVRAALSKP